MRRVRIVASTLVLLALTCGVHSSGKRSRAAKLQEALHGHDGDQGRAVQTDAKGVVSAVRGGKSGGDRRDDGDSDAQQQRGSKKRPNDDDHEDSPKSESRKPEDHHDDEDTHQGDTGEHGDDQEESSAGDKNLEANNTAEAPEDSKWRPLGALQVGIEGDNHDDDDTRSSGNKKNGGDDGDDDDKKGPKNSVAVPSVGVGVGNVVNVKGDTGDKGDKGDDDDDKAKKNGRGNSKGPSVGVGLGIGGEDGVDLEVDTPEVPAPVIGGGGAAKGNLNGGGNNRSGGRDDDDDDDDDDKDKHKGNGRGNGNGPTPKVVRPTVEQLQDKLGAVPDCATVVDEYAQFLSAKPGRDPALKNPEDRCKVYAEKKAYIEEFNQTHPDAPFQVAVNNFTDYNSTELVQLYGIKEAPVVNASERLDLSTANMSDLVDLDQMNIGDRERPEPTSPPTKNGSTSGTRRYWRGRLLPSLPDTIDYRNASLNPWGVVAVTSVKTQGTCGSCWAWTTAGVVEGQLAITYGSTRNLSPQNLVECVSSCKGCDGGQSDAALKYIANNGLATLGVYPYSGKDGTCSPKETYATVKGPSYIAACDEGQLQEALYYFGPMSVYVKADCQAFQAYASGVLDEDCITSATGNDLNTCSSNVDHAVLLVGYGTDQSTGLDYWLVKNTWGTSWGESGYFRLKRGAGKCGTSCIGAYPIATTKVVRGNQTYPTPDDPYYDVMEDNSGNSFSDYANQIADKSGEAAKEAAKEAKKAAKKVMDSPLLSFIVGAGTVAVVAVIGFFVYRRRQLARRGVRA